MLLTFSAICVQSCFTNPNKKEKEGIYFYTTFTASLEQKKLITIKSSVGGMLFVYCSESMKEIDLLIILLIVYGCALRNKWR